MNTDPTYNRLVELSWLRKLTPAEEAELHAWLALHPDARIDWENESGLDAALQQLPDAPMPSNFTARVLQAVEREAASGARRREGFPWRLPLRWLPRLAFAAVVAGAGLLSYQHTHLVNRQNLAKSVAAVSAVSSLPEPEILKDFDAIQALNPAPAPDEQLLAVLQ
jgi:anti-sigma factor RsiW